MYEPDPTIADEIYTLGNAWIDFGDQMWEKLSAMDASVQGVQWSGDAREIAVVWAWGPLRYKFTAAANHAWDVGNAINAYGDFIKDVQAKELHAAKMEAIKIMIIGLLSIIAVVALAVLLPLGTILAALTSVLEAMGVVMEGIALAATYAGAVAIDVILNIVVQIGADMGAEAFASAVTHTDMPDFGSKEWWKHEAINIGLAGAASLLAPGLKGIGALRRGLGDLARGPKLAPPKFDPHVEAPPMGGGKGAAGFDLPKGSFSPPPGLGNLDGQLVNKLPHGPGGGLPSRGNILPPKTDTVHPGGGLPQTKIPGNIDPHPSIAPPRGTKGNTTPHDGIPSTNSGRPQGELSHQPKADLGGATTSHPNPSTVEAPGAAGAPGKGAQHAGHEGLQKVPGTKASLEPT
ncbi:hypothetical protein FNZ23_28345, partial [Streptomyces benahoarensis]